MSQHLPTPLLDVRQLSVAIGAVRPVADVSFAIHGGETFALLGESGCGKSMTALALMRLLPDQARVLSGTVTLQGQELLGLPESAMRRWRGGHMGMIFQEPGTSLNPVLTVGKQIGEALALRGISGQAAEQAGIELLQAVGIPDPARRWQEYPFQMSGGMKQRIMIAQALAGQPQLILADEPTTALDVTIQARVLDLLADLQQQHGQAMLLISHDLGVVGRMASHVGVMYAGELVEKAPREQFFRRAAHPYSQKLFAALPDLHGHGQPLALIRGRVPLLNQTFTGCRFADRCDHAMARCRDEIPLWTRLEDGHEVRCHLYTGSEALVRPADLPFATAPNAVTAASASMTANLLDVHGVQVHFPIRRGLFQRTVGYVKAVDGVSFTLGKGKTLALVGESGCGKTTLGKALLGLIPATGGEWQIAEAEQGEKQDAKAMQMVFQDPFASLNPRMLVADIIAEGMVAAKIPGDHHARVEQLLTQVGLAPEMARRYPHEFSGGQRQRIAIARALAVSPRLLICDEPTSALDVSVQAQILNLLSELQRELGLSYLFITHNIAVVSFLADEVAVMYLGRIVESGKTDDVLLTPRHPYTQALIASVLKVGGESPAESPDGDCNVHMGMGDMPSPANPPSGCHFHPRCPYAMAVCRVDYPAITRLSGGHVAACHLLNDSGAGASKLD